MGARFVIIGEIGVNIGRCSANISILNYSRDFYLGIWPYTAKFFSDGMTVLIWLFFKLEFEFFSIAFWNIAF